jgi:hypothetical protein
MAKKARTSQPSVSVLTVTEGNLAELRKKLRGGTRARASAGTEETELLDALKRLEAGYRDLLRRRE